MVRQLADVLHRLLRDLRVQFRKRVVRGSLQVRQEVNRSGMASNRSGIENVEDPQSLVRREHQTLPFTKPYFNTFEGPPHSFGNL